jgi:tetratricopeptide (TPR) repeat protein
LFEKTFQPNKLSLILVHQTILFSKKFTHVQKEIPMNKSKLQILALCLAVFVSLTTAVNAQTNDELRQKVAVLVEADKFLEALPMLEKLAATDPDDANMQYWLGFAYLNKATAITVAEESKKFRIKSREAFIKAKLLGKVSVLLDGMIDISSANGDEKGRFSFNEEAEKLMIEAESFFAQGEMDKALEKYQKALTLDPKIYYAALFSGDVYLRKVKYDLAETWYQKAIAIDPYIETAYRYSATPLMKQGKTDQARDRYIESYITSPYNKLALSGIVNWGQATNTRLGHPKFNIPKTSTDADGKEKTTINMSVEDDGSVAWIGYTATRLEWKDKKFKATFPKELTYRHTLQEETEALRSVASMAKSLKGKKTKLSQELETLINLDNDGLLEPYILLAIPDNGIAEDHFAYLKSNREKLRQYVLKYVIGAGK